MTAKRIGGIFTLKNVSNETSEFSRIADARKAMKADYESFGESYDAEWSADGKDHCKRKVSKDEISIDVPIWDGENERESWIHARWKIVKL